MRRIPVIVLLAILAVVPLCAQDASAWYEDKPIADIRFEGLQNVSRTDLEGVIEPYIGTTYQNARFWDLQSKLFALDYFESFEVEAVPADDERSKVILVFHVVERPVVDRIELIGNRQIRRADILDTIVLTRGDMVNSSKVRADVEAIRTLYLERGYPEVSVDGRFEKTDESSARVIFEITEGTQTRVSEIRFSGNSFASASTLRRLIKTKEQSIFAGGIYKESNIAEDRIAIEQYYHDRGYIDATVVDVVRDVETDEESRSNLVLTYYIEEGNQYSFGGIGFEGNTLYSDERLSELIRLESGEILNQSKLVADLNRISQLYYSDGYIYNTITTEETRDEQNREIAYNVSIVERGRAHIENIIVRGNEKTKEEVILREFPLEVGDVFSARSFNLGRQNLMNTQYFSTIVPDVVQGSAEGLVDIILAVEEGRTTDINFGLTFSGQTEGFPVIGFLKWTDNNFQGNGQELSIGTEISAGSQSLTFGFQENWLFGQRWSGGVDVSAEHSLSENIQQDILPPIFARGEDNAVPDPYDGHYVWADDGTPYDETPGDLESYKAAGDVVTDYAYAIQEGEVIDPSYLMDYDSYDISLGLNTGYTFHTRLGRLGLGTRLSATFSYVDYDKDLFRPYDPTIRENHQKLLPIMQWLLNASFDTRDIINNPSKGYYFKQSVTYTGGILPSTRDYIRTNTKAQAFFTLFDVPAFEGWNFKEVLALSSSLSFVFPQFGGELNATTQDRLYIDGMTVAKGWPRIYDGRAMWDTWVELRMPIVEQYLWWDWFFDTAAIWSDLTGFAAMDAQDFLFSFGGGLRLTVPGLPIGLYLAKRFRITDTGVEWQTGDIFQSEKEGSGLDFVISFTADIF